MQLSVSAGGVSWLVMNGAMAAWNAYLPLMKKERYADLAGLLLPVLQTLLQVCGAVGFAHKFAGATSRTDGLAWVML
jgi:hypothetical protein